MLLTLDYSMYFSFSGLVSSDFEFKNWCRLGKQVEAGMCVADTVKQNQSKPCLKTLYWHEQGVYWKTPPTGIRLLKSWVVRNNISGVQGKIGCGKSRKSHAKLITWWQVPSGPRLHAFADGVWGCFTNLRAPVLQRLPPCHTHCQSAAPLAKRRRKE